MPRKKKITRTNPQAAEFWQGYRDALSEILLLGIEAFEAKYNAEFDGNDGNVSNHFKGMKRALEEDKRRLSAMLKD